MTNVEKQIRKLHLGGILPIERTRSDSDFSSIVQRTTAQDISVNEQVLQTSTVKPITPGPCTDDGLNKKRKKRAPKSRLAAKFQLQVEQDIASGSQKKLSEMWGRKNEGDEQ